jgi:2-(1,2-epoxy-1,2-dihydrophenyl)acetyl-CoA isomerase
MTDPVLRIERDGDVCIAVFNEPKRLNPLSVALQQALLDLCRRLADPQDTLHTVRCLVLTGAGKAFCVGADLDAMQAPADPADTLGAQTAHIMRTLTNEVVLALRALPQPVLSVVNGPCAGAGVGLALSADLVLIGRGAYFYMPFMPRLGIVPDMGATWFLERFCGSSRALAMTLLGDRIAGPQAVQAGLAHACHDEAALHDEALALARRLARLPAHAALETRRAFDAARRHTLAEQLAFEAQRQHELIDRPTFGEGVRAFVEKREPDFKDLA